MTLQSTLEHCKLKIKEISALSKRDKLSDYLPWFVYDKNEQLFINVDDTGGFIWECQPLAFCGEKQIKALDSLLNQEFPKGTVMQWILCDDRHIEPFIESYLSTKRQGDTLARKTAEEYAKFLYQSRHGMPQAKQIPVRCFRLFVTLKSPHAIDLDQIAVIEETLQGAGLFPRRWTADDLIYWGRQFFNGEATPNQCYSEDKPLGKQIINADTDIVFKPKEIRVADKLMHCLTVESNAKTIDAFVTNKLFGGIMGLQDDTSQITCQFMFTLTIVFDDMRTKMNLKLKPTLSLRAGGFISPGFKKRVKEFSKVEDALDEKERYLTIMPTLWLMSDSDEILRKNTARVSRIWENIGGFKLQVESRLNQILFISSLPFGFYHYPGNMELIDRHSIQSTRAISEFIPFQTDFQGSSKPVLAYVGRKGQFIGLDVFDKRANAHNFIVAAETGAGKSFNLNFLCSNYHASGAKVRIIDIGYSYKKLAKTAGGRYLDFSTEHVCINPFDFVYNDEEDKERGIDAANNVLSQMVYSASGQSMPETEWTLIKQATSWIMRKGRQEEGIDAVYDYLHKYPKFEEHHADIPRNVIEIAHNLAFNLQDFTSKGIYGKYFNGPSNFSIKNDDFVVIELESLRSMAELFGVVFMQVMNNVTQDLYLSDRSRPCFILCEETASLLKETGQKDLSRFGDMIEEGFRRARKYSGSFGVVLQSLLDIKQFGPIGEVILGQATFKFLLEGKTYREAVNQGIVDYDGLAFELLDSVKNNKPHYSEMFIDSPFGMGVARLAVDPWTYWVNTSSGPEVYQFEQLLKTGMTPFAAIQQLSGVQ